MSTSDFSKLGFNQYESVDLQIMMSLKTAEDIREWMDAVGDEDVQYGIDLMTRACEMQRLKDIDDSVNGQTEFPEINELLAGLK